LTENKLVHREYPKGFCVAFTPSICKKLESGFSQASTDSANLSKTLKIHVWSSFFSSLSDSSQRE